MEEEKRRGLKKKVLIITYYWPPAGGGGVMRWLKLTKYLAKDTNWEPIIYTPENAGYLIRDESLLSEVPSEIEVIRKKIIEPNNFLDALGLKKFKSNVASGGVGKKKNKNSLIQQFLIWIRSNIFIPDPRMLWIKPSIRFLLDEVIKHRNIDAIITTGPPHSMHLIGLGIKEKTGIPWIADFRDPWTFIDFFDDLDLSKSALKKHHCLEKKVLENADDLVTVSPSCASEFEQRNKNINFKVIYNGFDPDDFKHEVSEIDKEFSIVHIGSLNKDRNAEMFWNAVSEMCSSIEDFKGYLKIRLIGSVTAEVSTIVEELELKENVSIEHHKSHAEVLDIIQKAQLLLLLINDTSSGKGILPGKLYEYFGADRPILCIGDPDADAGQLISRAKAGKVVDFDDKEGVKTALGIYYEQYRKLGVVPTQTKEISRFSRREEAMEYAALLDTVCIKR